jgi:hypothetical protein
LFDLSIILWKLSLLLDIEMVIFNFQL